VVPSSEFHKQRYCDDLDVQGSSNFWEFRPADSLHSFDRGENAPDGPNGETGDNLRERIYATVYPRLTTKSNTFTVHVRAQALKKPLNDPSPGTWEENPSRIVSEYRGSTTIERFVEPNNPAIPDYAARAEAGTLFGASAPETPDSFSMWRTVGNQQFAPWTKADIQPQLAAKAMSQSNEGSDRNVRGTGQNANGMGQYSQGRRPW
jgi:hypothetical protein